MNKQTLWVEITRSIKQRDGNRCTSCKESKPRLHIHHIDYSGNPGVFHFTSNNRPDNLITLCGSCHQKRHMDEARAAGFKSIPAHQAAVTAAKKL